MKLIDNVEMGNRRYELEALENLLKDYSSIDTIIFQKEEPPIAFTFNGYQTRYLDIYVDEAKYYADVLRFGNLQNHIDGLKPKNSDSNVFIKVNIIFIDNKRG